MTTQDLLNAISILSGTIDPLIRADKKEDVTSVIKKMLELIEKMSCMKEFENPQDVVHSNVKHETAYIPCLQDDERCVGSFTSNDGRCMCHVREFEIVTENNQPS